MTSTIRLEIVIDSVGTDDVLNLVKPFEELTYTIHRAVWSQSHGNSTNSDDLSDSLSYNLILLFIPDKTFSSLEKTLLETFRKYNASVYKSSCTQIS